MGGKPGEDAYGSAAGAIGALAVAAGILAAIRDRLGLSWPATVLLTAGFLTLLGYGVWKARTELARWQARRAASGRGFPAPAEPGPDRVPGGGQSAESEPAHPLTAVLAGAGAIGKDESIRPADVRTGQLPGIGTVYEFLLPEGRTQDDVAKRLGPVASMLGVTRLHLKMDASRSSERHVRLLKLDEPPFSRPFPSPGREEIRAFGGVPLGRDITGQLAGVPTFDKASLLVGGMTQTGKTTLVNGLITCLLIAYGEFDLYLLDGKLCGLTRFEKAAVRYEASDDPAVLESMAGELNARVDERYTKIQTAVRERKPAPQFRPVFFVIDEAADFFTDNGTKESREQVRRVEEKTRSLVAKSLESRIHVIMLTQRPSRDAIPVKVRDQFVYRMCLYVASEGSAKVALGDSYFETLAPVHPALLDPGIKGQAVLFANGSSTLLRGFSFPDEFIWSVVDDVYDRRQKELSHTPQSPLTQAIGLMRSRGAGFMLTSELAPALGITGNSPGDTGLKLGKALGVPASRGAKGARGYRLADLTAAALSRD
ncbi:FtsK/SpoIIIE domain-containing protein [Streptomyces sp. NPDC001774]